MAGKFPIFGYRDFLVVDESTLNRGRRALSQNLSKNLKRAMRFLRSLACQLRRIGLDLATSQTAKIFTDIVYDLCNISGFNRLFAMGYLSPLIPKPTNTKLDISKRFYVGR